MAFIVSPLSNHRSQHLTDRIVAVDHLVVDVPDLSRRFGDADPVVVTARFGVMHCMG